MYQSLLGSDLVGGVQYILRVVKELWLTVLGGCDEFSQLVYSPLVALVTFGIVY